MEEVGVFKGITLKDWWGFTLVFIMPVLAFIVFVFWGEFPYRNRYLIKSFVSDNWPLLLFVVWVIIAYAYAVIMGEKYAVSQRARRPRTPRNRIGHARLRRLRGK